MRGTSASHEGFLARHAPAVRWLRDYRRGLVPSPDGGGAQRLYVKLAHPAGVAIVGAIPQGLPDVGIPDSPVPGSAG